MSSHHIIRDKQEPALMVANGASCRFELLGQLLEWSPFILVLDGALDRILQLGVKVDAVLGDFDSVNVQRLSTEMEQEIKWIHTPDQHKTDFEKGLEYLIEEGHKAVTIVWATGNRLDHTYNNLLSVAKFHERINMSLIDDHSRMFVLPKTYTKFYPANTILSLLPITDVFNLRTSGMRYNFTGENLIVPEKSGSSNDVVDDGIVKIEYDSGILLLMECSDL